MHFTRYLHLALYLGRKTQTCRFHSRFSEFLDITDALSLSVPLFLPPTLHSLLLSSSFKYHLLFHPTFSRASLTFKYYSRSKSYSLAFFATPRYHFRSIIFVSLPRYYSYVRRHEKSLRMPGVSSCSLSSAVITTPAAASPNKGFICRRMCLPSSRR